MEKALTTVQSGGAGVNTTFEQVVPESIPFGFLDEASEELSGNFKTPPCVQSQQARTVGKSFFVRLTKP